MGNARGKQALDNLLKKFYTVKEGRGKILGEFFWCQSEIFELIADACEAYDDDKYRNVMDEMFEGFIGQYGEDWGHNPYNDDIMWMTIGSIRAYKLTRNPKYLDCAVRHFHLVYDRAWSSDLGGGLFWRIENTTKNACVNGPAVIAGALIALETGDEVIRGRTKLIYDWERRHLFGPDGAVYDAYNLETGIKTWCSTYNQGTFIGASLLMHELFGGQEYIDQAVLAMEHTRDRMYGGGVMGNEDEGGDMPGFKGIFARWALRLVRDFGQDQFAQWLRLNADTAWVHQNSEGLIWTRWPEQTPDQFYGAWGCSAAVSMLINCP